MMMMPVRRSAGGCRWCTHRSQPLFHWSLLPQCLGKMVSGIRPKLELPIIMMTQFRIRGRHKRWCNKGGVVDPLCEEAAYPQAGERRVAAPWCPCKPGVAQGG